MNARNCLISLWSVCLEQILLALFISTLQQCSNSFRNFHAWTCVFRLLLQCHIGCNLMDVLEDTPSHHTCIHTHTHKGCCCFSLLLFFPSSYSLCFPFWLELGIVAESCRRHPLFTACTVFIAWLTIGAVLVLQACFMGFAAWLLRSILNVLVVVCIKPHALSSSGVASFAGYRYQKTLEKIPEYKRGGGGFGPAYCNINCSRHQLLNKEDLFVCMLHRCS